MPVFVPEYIRNKKNPEYSTVKYLLPYQWNVNKLYSQSVAIAAKRAAILCNVLQEANALSANDCRRANEATLKNMGE